MADPVVSLVVYGTPGTAGSKSSFPIYRGTGADRHFTGKVATTEKPSKVKTTWRAAVTDAANKVVRDPDFGWVQAGFPLDEALVVSMVFTVKKPTAAPKRVRTWPTTRPDVLKYARATEDALVDAGLMTDDARIVEYIRLAKVYPREDPDALNAPGVRVKVWRMAEVWAGDPWHRLAGPWPVLPLAPPGGVPQSPPPGVGGSHG